MGGVYGGRKYEIYGTIVYESTWKYMKHMDGYEELYT